MITEAITNDVEKTKGFLAGSTSGKTDEKFGTAKGLING
jgi:hypothetical protein